MPRAACSASGRAEVVTTKRSSQDADGPPQLRALARRQLKRWQSAAGGTDRHQELRETAVRREVARRVHRSAEFWTGSVMSGPDQTDVRDYTRQGMPNSRGLEMQDGGRAGADLRRGMNGATETVPARLSVWSRYFTNKDLSRHVAARAITASRQYEKVDDHTVGQFPEPIYMLPECWPAPRPRGQCSGKAAWAVVAPAHTKQFQRSTRERRAGPEVKRQVDSWVAHVPGKNDGPQSDRRCRGWKTVSDQHATCESSATRTASS